MDGGVINIDPEILGGTPVFSGTRVPIKTIFDHINTGVSLDEFLDDFPTVTKEQAIAVIEMSKKNNDFYKSYGIASEKLAEE